MTGAAGLGKTALAAKALATVVGATASSLAGNPFPDGVVLLDLYAIHGAAESIWDGLASKLAGPNFMERTPAWARATAACQGRRILVVIEGGEEAHGQDGRPAIRKLLSVLSPENRWLLLTRLTTQADAAKSIRLKEALSPENAARLFDSLTRGSVPGAVRTRALELLEGHPLALTWAAAHILASEDEDSQRLLEDWEMKQLPALSDPMHAEHTLEWLFERSTRGVDETATRVLEAAGLLARTAFPFAAMEAALGGFERSGAEAVRRALKDLVHRSLLMRTGEADEWQFTHALGYRFARKESGSDPAIRTGLGGWLHARLSAELATGDSQAIGDALEHLNALLRTDHDQGLYVPLVQAALYRFIDRLNELGGLVRVKLLLSAVDG